MTRGVWVLLGMSALFAAVVVLTATKGSDGWQRQPPLVRATPPDPAPTPPPPPTPGPTQVPLPGPPLVLPVFPTPEPGREGPETTLVEVATGRSLRLLQTGHLILRIRFSPGGRWLVYDDAPLKGNEPEAAHSAIYRVDLHEGDLRTQKLSDGILPLYSPNGDLAFFTTRKESLITGAYNLHVFRADGTLMTPKQEAFPGTLSWSPDGRWLAYQKLELAHRAGDQPSIANLVVNLRTGEIKAAGMSYATGHVRLAEWSPDSKRLIFGPSRWLGEGRYGDSLYEVSARKLQSIESLSTWLPDGRIASFEKMTSGEGSYTNVYARAPDDANSTLFAAGLANPFELTAWSPDGKVVAVIGTGSASSAVARRFVAAGSELVVLEVPGYGINWSHNGQFLMALGRAGDCSGISVFRASDGTRLLCINAPLINPGNAAFSPTTGEVAYISASALGGGPLRFPFQEPWANELRIVNIETGAERTVLTDARGYLNCVTWSPDAKWLAVSNFCRDE